MYHTMNITDKPEYLHPTTDTRNVADQFKGMSTDAIRLAMQPVRVPAVNIAMNLTHDFNKGSVLRASEAHAFKEFVLVNHPNPQRPESKEGIKKVDWRGAVGMRAYANIRYVVDWENLLDNYRSEGYTIFAVDNIPSYEPKPIYDTVMPLKSAFVYGEEGLGLSNEVIAKCDKMIYIPQFGVVRSLNIAQAAAICMYEYSRQNRPIL